MHLRAISIGGLVPGGDFEGCIHSAFHQAVNLRLDGRRILYTLTASGETDLPQGIRLDTPGGFSFKELPPGCRVVCREKALFFENFPLQVDLRPASIWMCNLRNLCGSLETRQAAAAWSAAWSLLNDRQKSTGSEILAEALAGPLSAAMSTAARRMGRTMQTLVRYAGDNSPVEFSVFKNIIGLGVGLTPAGDDLLSGWMAGLWAVNGDIPERRRFLFRLGRAVVHQAQGTNDISQTYLILAARGQVSSPVEDLARAICKGDETQALKHAASRAMQSGHTSGMDMVTGLLLGLAAWAPAKLSEAGFLCVKSKAQ